MTLNKSTDEQLFEFATLLGDIAKHQNQKYETLMGHIEQLTSTMEILQNSMISDIQYAINTVFKNQQSAQPNPDSPQTPSTKCQKQNEKAVPKESQAPDMNRHLVQEAKSYDDPDFSGRNIRAHREWIAELPVPVIELDGAQTRVALVEAAVGALDGAAVAS